MRGEWGAVAARDLHELRGLMSFLAIDVVVLDWIGVDDDWRNWMRVCRVHLLVADVPGSAEIQQLADDTLPVGFTDAELRLALEAMALRGRVDS